MADWGSDLPFSACRDHVVDYEKDGNHPNFRDRFRNHARFSTTSQRLCGRGRDRNSCLGFWVAQVEMIGYQAQVLPAILAGFALVFIEKFFRKITPALISMIVVPLCSLVLAVLVAHTILGPIGWVVGGWISDIV